MHERVLAEAVANHATLGNQLAADGIEAMTEAGAQLRREIGARIQAAKMREFVTLGVMLGTHCGDSPCVVPDGTPAPPADFVNYVPSSRPGALAPHAWLHDGSSLYDHFGAGFTLLASPGANGDDIVRAARDAAALGLALAHIAPPEGGIAAHYPRCLTLIRPDQHVAWRGDAWPADGAALLRRVRGQVAT